MDYILMMGMKSLEELFSDLSETDKLSMKKRKPVTVWLPEEYKIKYGKIQETSNGKFCKKIRELIIMSIDMVESKTS